MGFSKESLPETGAADMTHDIKDERGGKKPSTKAKKEKKAILLYPYHLWAAWAVIQFKNTMWEGAGSGVAMQQNPCNYRLERGQAKTIPTV